MSQQGNTISDTNNGRMALVDTHHDLRSITACKAANNGRWTEHPVAGETSS
ncbi:MAG TPA: hypothetical protein ACQGQH_08675 [Xylella sp.]